jgi:hypothetical protein
MEIKLSQYARENGIDYINCYRAFKRGELTDARQTSTGAILINVPDKSQPAPVHIAVASEKIPEIKFQNISMASSSNSVLTRSNKSADTEIINRFANIDSGIIPYMPSTNSGYNKSGITMRDCVILCQKAYFNIAIFRQVIDLIVDLSIGNMRLKGGNKKSRDFIAAYFRKVGINETFQVKWFLELWRSSNVLTFAYTKKLKPDDVGRITKLYGAQQANADKAVTLPVDFTILNPADIQIASQSIFLMPRFYKVLNGYELERLKNPKTDRDKEVFQSLPPETRKAIMAKNVKTITIQLESENLYPTFHKKTDYEGMAIPVFFPVLDDLNWKLQLKKMDMATTRMLNQAILLVTTGTEPEKGGINPQNLTNLQNIFLNESVGRVLIADYTTKAQFIIPEISSILDPKKYEVVNNDIYIGLNYILLQAEKFANKQTALQIFIEKIKFGRRLFINEFVTKIIEKVCKELNFKSIPEAYFEPLSIESTVELDRIYGRLAEIGYLTPEEAFDALQNGILPLKDESIENQTEFKALKDKGFYQPIVGGPANQMNLLKQTQKGASDLQSQQLEHQAKEAGKQRKHDAENPPPAPPPSIHFGMPKAIKQPNGRPPGTGTPQSTKKVKPLGASIISGQKVIENTIKYDKLERVVIDGLLNKHNLKTLTASQMDIAKEMVRIIVRNEEPSNWESSIGKYLDKPIDNNLERIDAIEELALEHQLEPHLAAIVFASLKEEEKEKTIEIPLLEENEKI